MTNFTHYEPGQSRKVRLLAAKFRTKGVRTCAQRVLEAFEGEDTEISLCYTTLQELAWAVELAQQEWNNRKENYDADE